MYNKEIHNRKSIRLRKYDYSKTGIYFITICTQNRENILSKIPNVGAGLVSAQTALTKIGKQFEQIYMRLEGKFKNIKLHDYVFMPNHIHGIIEICEKVDARFGADTRPAPTLGNIICSFKSETTLEYIRGVKQGIYEPFNKRIWQRNYYEHIVRNQKEYLQIQQYIKNNPLKWQQDQLFIL